MVDKSLSSVGPERKRQRTSNSVAGSEGSLFAGLEALLESSVRRAVAEHLGSGQGPAAGGSETAGPSHTDLEQRISVLEKELHDMKRQMQSSRAQSGNKVSDGGSTSAQEELKGSLTLKVGSRKFQTTAETLKIVQDSFFSSLASGRVPQKREKDGSIFIDRNPKHFQYVLDYLRCNGEGFTPPTSKTAQDELRAEADFYGLADLATSLRRLCISSNHLMTIGKKGAVLSGNRFGAAMLDVRDPDNFAITLQFSGWQESDYQSGANESPFLVGIGPAGTELSQLWLKGECPVVDIPSLPSDEYTEFTNSYLQVTRLQPATSPSSVSYPPVFQEGVFFASPCFRMTETSQHFPGGLENRYACYQFSKQRTHLCKCSRWQRHQIPPKKVRMHFVRGSEGAFIEFRFSVESSAKVWKVDLGAEGIDCNRDYRPMVFFTRHGMSVTIEELMS